MSILDTTTGHVLLGVLVGAILGAVIGWLVARVSRAAWTRQVRETAIQQSQAVTTGKVFEQLAPYLPDFEFNPKDARFLGTPVDLVVFDGLADGEVRRVVFVEVKTGNAGLTGRERQVRDVIEARAVEWAELRVGRR